MENSLKKNSKKGPFIPYKQRDNNAPYKQRDNVPYKQRINVFAENQRKKIIKSFEGIVEKITPHATLSANYRQFVTKVNNPVNRRIVKLLPILLLAITVLAVKNKRLIKPFVEAFQIASETAGPSGVADKAVLIVKEYSKFFSKMTPIESLELALSTLSFFLEDIPAVFERLDLHHGLSQLTIYKNIFRNAADIKKDFVDKPKKDKKEKDLQYEQKKFQQEQRQIDKKLREDMKKFLEEAIKAQSMNEVKQSSNKQTKKSPPARKT